MLYEFQTAAVDKLNYQHHSVGFEVLTAVVTLLTTCFHAGFLLGLFFDPEDGDMLL
jgi:hypothetical protein